MSYCFIASEKLIVIDEIYFFYLLTYLYSSHYCHYLHKNFTFHSPPDVFLTLTKMCHQGVTDKNPKVTLFYVILSQFSNKFIFRALINFHYVTLFTNIHKKISNLINPRCFPCLGQILFYRATFISEITHFHAPPDVLL